jgi:hypothetical protein
MFSENMIAVIVIVFIIGFPIYFLYLAKPARIINKLHSIKEKKIIDVKEGEVVRIKGKIKCLGKTLSAPLSGRKCVYYHTVVERENDHRNRGISPQWSHLIEEEISGDIIVSDGKRYAVIDTRLVDSYLVMDKEYRSGYLKNAALRLEKYLEKHGHKSTGFFGDNNSIRYKEGVLEEGELIAVAGKATWKTKKDFQFDLPVDKILLIHTDDWGPVHISDDPFAVSRSIEY